MFLDLGMWKMLEIQFGYRNVLFRRSVCLALSFYESQINIGSGNIVNNEMYGLAAIDSGS